MHILVTNDDGVTAPGLMVLAQAMRDFGEVSVLAPDHDWSGGGHVKTFGGDRPTGVPKEGTDVGALASGYASVTPLKLDLTAYEMLDPMRKWIGQTIQAFNANGH